ncbi:NACHT domain-containing protein [Actinocorallia libanotica]|uniref:NACHT domain-containing protein n=1 Tax=Actinocorallia libanotica TaxID=46162 RepID=A0ABP4BB00_9ACTN
MSVRQRVLLVAVVTAMVPTGVAGNQVLQDGKWNWWALGAALAIVVAAEGVNQWLQHRGEGEPGPGDGRESRRGYLRRVRSSVGHMETIGLVTQAEFVLRTRQVYVDVMLRPRTVSDAAVDPGVGPRRRGGPVAGRRAPLGSFLDEGCVLAVLGAAGSGKTTLARYTALEMAARRPPPWRRDFWRRRRIPVLLYLRDHAETILGEPPRSLAQVAAEARWLGGVVAAGWLERRLAAGRCVVLLDGLDEVADTADRARVVRWVETQIGRYPGNSFVVTSRPAGYDANRLPGADVLQVQRFTSGQIHDFLHSWYRAIERRARRSGRHDDPGEIDRIAAAAADDLFHRISGSPALYDLAANPLLLTMIANVHRYRSGLPGSRVALYEEMCQVLLHRRQEAKGLVRPAEPDGVDGDRQQRVVQEIAWHMMRNRLRDISLHAAERAIRPVLERTVSGVSPHEFLTRIKKSGLLLERRYRHYGFVHLTLQEYLAASLVPEHHARRQILIDNVGDPWWRETTLLWAARNDATPVVEACLHARTVTSLGLAYACAAEARELDAPVRARLDEILASDPVDPEETRLLDGVAAARALSRTRALDDSGARICAAPVDQELWSRHTFRDRLPSSPAARPWTSDVRRFLSWLDYLTPGGIGYRLPTPAEARLAHSGGLHETVLWAAEHGARHPVLVVPPHLPHPHRPTPQQIAAYPDLILDHTRLLFLLLHPRSPLTFTQLIAYARPRDLSRQDHRLIQAIDLVHAIDNIGAHTPALASALSRVLNRVLIRAPDLDSARSIPRDLTHVRAYGFPRGLDIERNYSSDLYRAHGLARGLGIDLDHAQARARAQARDLGIDLARELDIAHELDLRLAPGPFSIESDRDFYRDLAYARAVRASYLGELSPSVLFGLASACRHVAHAFSRQVGAMTTRQRRAAPRLPDFLREKLDSLAAVPPADDPKVVLKELRTRTGKAEKAALLTNALDNVSLLTSRIRPVRQSDIVLAATAVLAVLLADEGDPESEDSPLLRGLLAALIAITPDTDDAPSRDRHLVLVPR